MSSVNQSRSIPSTVTSRLRAVRRKQFGVRALEGLLVGMAVLLAAMLLAMAVDWLIVLFSPTARTAVTVAALVLGATAFVLCAVRLVLAQRRLSAIARQVDQAVPRLEERWSTVTELAESEDPPEIRGSDVMIDRVSSEAEELGPLVAHAHIVSKRTVRRCTLALAGAVALFSLVLLAGGAMSTVLLKRFLAPGSNISMTRLRSLTGDRAVPRGESLVIEAEAAGRLRDSATLMIRNGDDLPQEVELSRQTTGDVAFTYKIRAVKKSFAYRIRSGDGQTPWHTVTAVDRPAIAQVQFRVAPPEYSKLPVHESDSLPRRHKALEGSRLEVAFLPNKPVRQMVMKFDKGKTALQPGQENWYRWETTLAKTIVFSVHLTDEYDLTNTKPTSCRIVVYPDRPPHIEIVSPEEEITVRPDEKVPVTVKITEDIGVTNAELVVTKKVDGQEKELKVIPIPLGDKDSPKKVKATVEIDLKEFKLTQGDELTYVARATDARQATSSTKGSISQPKEGSPGETKIASAGDPKQDGSQEDPLNSASRPPNDMATRQLPASGAACSGKQRIQIDEWAGTYEGQRRKKLQIAIEKYLKRLDEHLAAAEKPTYKLVDHVRAKKPWAGGESGQLNTARKHLVGADEVISELMGVSARTPYAFVGLQVQDIGVSHVSPAGKHLAEASRLPKRPTDQYKELAQGGYHITRARARLAGLTKQYEAVKREKELEEAIAQVKKMHQMFLEDLHTMLNAAKPKLNPRSGKMLELSDEEIEKLKKLIEERAAKLKELMAALAEALEKDPELLKRFMAAMRLDAATVRDQLTLLAMRQQELYSEIKDWAGRSEGGRKKTQARMAEKQTAEQMELAEEAAQLYDRMVTWLPRDIDVTQAVVRDCRSQSNSIARSAQRVATEMASGKADRSSALALELAKELAALDTALSELGNLDESNDRLVNYTFKRKAEVRKLSTQEAGWAVKVRAILDGKYGQCGKIDQGRLLMDTTEFGGKLERYETMLSRLSPEIARKATELRETVAEETVGHQRMARAALAAEELSPARTAEGKAVESFSKAEKLFDELLTLIEKKMADEAVAKAPDSLPPLPSIEELLAMFENEFEACEKLGAACMMINLMIQGDWQLPGPPQSGSGSGQGSGSGSGQGEAAMGQAQMAKAALQKAIEQMEKMEQEAERQAGRLAKLPPEQEGPLDPTAKRDRGDDREWNTLVGKLEKELRQARDNVPPEQYRKIIDEYFRALGESLEAMKADQ